MSPDPPHMVLDVSCVMTINHEVFFAAGAIFIANRRVAFHMASAACRENWAIAGARNVAVF